MFLKRLLFLIFQAEKNIHEHQECLLYPMFLFFRLWTQYGAHSIVRLWVFYVSILSKKTEVNISIHSFFNPPVKILPSLSLDYSSQTLTTSHTDRCDSAFTGPAVGFLSNACCCHTTAILCLFMLVTICFLPFCKIMGVTCSARLKTWLIFLNKNQIVNSN